MRGGALRPTTEKKKKGVALSPADAQHIVLSNSHNVYPKSASGRRNPVPPRRTATQPTPVVQPTRTLSSVDTEEVVSSSRGNRAAMDREQHQRFHWLVDLSLAMVVMPARWIHVRTTAELL